MSIGFAKHHRFAVALIVHGSWSGQSTPLAIAQFPVREAKRLVETIYYVLADWVVLPAMPLISDDARRAPHRGGSGPVA